MPFTYAYPRPAVTTDCLVFRQGRQGWEILLIRRGQPPFEGHWALPGGFLNMDETLEQTAARELREETGLDGVGLRQFRAYSDLDRDPRQRTIGVVFYAFLHGPAELRAGDDAAEAAWFPVGQLPGLAFDHDLIVRDGMNTLLREGDSPAHMEASMAPTM